MQAEQPQNRRSLDNKTCDGEGEVEGWCGREKNGGTRIGASWGEARR